MTDTPPPAITSRSSHVAALQWGFAQATSAAARRIVCVDRDFADWPLDDPALQHRLAAWLRLPQRRLVLLAAELDTLQRRHPRFVGWRTPWAHAIEAWSPAADEANPNLPSVLADDVAHSVQLVDGVHWRGRAAVDTGRARGWLDRIDAILQRSERTFAVTRLGL